MCPTRWTAPPFIFVIDRRNDLWYTIGDRATETSFPCYIRRGVLMTSVFIFLCRCNVHPNNRSRARNFSLKLLTFFWKRVILFSRDDFVISPNLVGLAITDRSSLIFLLNYKIITETARGEFFDLLLAEFCFCDIIRMNPNLVSPKGTGIPQAWDHFRVLFVFSIDRPIGMWYNATWGSCRTEFGRCIRALSIDELRHLIPRRTWSICIGFSWSKLRHNNSVYFLFVFLNHSQPFKRLRGVHKNEKSAFAQLLIRKLGSFIRLGEWYCFASFKANKISLWGEAEQYHYTAEPYNITPTKSEYNSCFLCWFVL